MYSANTEVSRPKQKIGVSLVTTDREILDGHVFTTGDARVKDVLNGNDQFVAFEGRNGAIYLLNRNSIARVVLRKNTVTNLDTREEVEVA